MTLSGRGSRKREREDDKPESDKPLGIATWNMEGSKWSQPGNSPWDSVKKWMTSNETSSQKASPYKLSIGCFQEAGVPPDSIVAHASPVVETLRDRNEATGELGVAKVSTYHWRFGSNKFPRHRPPEAWVYYYKWPGPKPKRASSGWRGLRLPRWRVDPPAGRVNQAIVSATPAEELAFIHHELGLRPLIGAKIDGTWYFTLHAPSGGEGGDGWWLVKQVSQRYSTPWWVLGDYNLEPDVVPRAASTSKASTSKEETTLQKKFDEERVNALICEPNKITRRKSGKKFDYAVRNRTAKHLTGEVLKGSADRSDHEIVFYPLAE